MPDPHGRTTIVWMLAPLLLLAPVSCRKPSEAEKSDLKEAGYTLTAADWTRAAAQDDVPALKKFIAAGFDAATTDADGNTALHTAAAGGARRAADFLLGRGIAIDARGSGGLTPLMSAVRGNQGAMAAWLLRQGADPSLKDEAGYSALMLAVKENATAALAEIAPYDRENLDSALLLAALTGHAAAIDTLTNFGASVYARMDDGRTPLMLAAENGHTDAVELLLDIGSSRFSTDQQGRAAADLANTAGHAEIAAMILETSRPGEFSIESPEEIATAMETYVDTSLAAADTGENTVAPQPNTATSPRPAVVSIEGATLGASNKTPADTAPPIIMRHYRQREMPVAVRTVHGDTATLAILGGETREVTVRAGETIPGTTLTVVRVRERVTDSKLNLGRPEEISVVEVRDTATGASREWITGLPATAHDPVALVEDAATGRRYTAAPGRKFRGSEGTEYLVSDVRPNQLVIENTATGETRTIPLRGPRG